MLILIPVRGKHANGLNDIHVLSVIFIICFRRIIFILSYFSYLNFARSWHKTQTLQSLFYTDIDDSHIQQVSVNLEVVWCFREMASVCGRECVGSVLNI